MGQGISAVLTFAIGVAISPVPIIAVILMLFSQRARVNGPAFLVGWVVALAIVSTVVYVASHDGNVAQTSSTASDSVSWGNIALGVGLLALAAATGASARPRARNPPCRSGWRRWSPCRRSRRWDSASRSPPCNPKNLILTAGAAAGLAQVAGLSTTDAVVAIAVFVVIASLTIAGPVVYALVGGARAKATLDSAKTWLTAHNAAVMAVLFLVFGVDLIAKGLPPTDPLSLRRAPTSVLVGRAPVGGAPADDLPAQLGPVRGQRPPSWRSSMSSPMCEPPRRDNWRSVARSAACSRRSSSSSSGVRRPGASSARHRISSASRLPTPASRSWSMSRALSGPPSRAVPGSRRQRGLELAPCDRERVRPEPALVGRELDRAEAARVVQQEVAPVVEGDAHPHPFVVEDARPVAEAVECLVPVDHQAARHAEAQAQRRAPVGVEQQQLPPPASRGERAADQGRPQPCGVVPPRP